MIEEKPQKEPPKKRGRPRKEIEPLITCAMCGSKKKEENYFKNNRSALFRHSHGFTNICKDCLREITDEIQARTKDEKLTCIALCHYCDAYFSEYVWQQSTDLHDSFSFGKYLRMINCNQYDGKTFLSTLEEIVFPKLEGDYAAKQKIESRWNKGDTKNKNYVLSSVGYDPFDDDSYTVADRKFLFNSLADYLSDDVLDDPHKVQCVISMVKSLFQIEKLNRMINAEIRKTIPDYALIDKLAATKDKLTKSVNSTAADNGISAKGGGRNTVGANTLTKIMKDMYEDGIEEVKPNVIEAKLADSYKWVAKESVKAIIKELEFTQDEYAEMLSKQTELVADLQERNDKLSEELREAKIKLWELTESDAEAVGNEPDYSEQEERQGNFAKET